MDSNNLSTSKELSEKKRMLLMGRDISTTSSWVTVQCTRRLLPTSTSAVSYLPIAFATSSVQRMVVHEDANRKVERKEHAFT